MEPALCTERLSLKLVSLADLLDIHALHALPETNEFNTLGIPENPDQTRKVLQDFIDAAHRASKPEYTFAIRVRQSQAFIGLIALKCGNPMYRMGDVWYKIHKDHWRKGFATEALRAVLAYGFGELQLHRIEAGCAVANKGSVAVLKKVGMQKEGSKRKVLPLASGWSDNYEYAILEEDWK
ncbi:MAG: GNAT family N-acetyltransferase [Bacteroidetes bacterium]|nr:GNAT family N-acetyltransferase [Bacteroidota bacterium]